MTTKKYLDSVRHADREIESKTRVLKKMKSQLYSIQAAQIKEDVVTGGKKITGEDRIVRAMEYEKELISELMDLFELKEEARRYINRLDKEVSRTVLFERYLNNNQWNDVADFMGYEERYTKRLHNEALKELSEIKDRKTLKDTV